jgi:hypothetical protein
MAQFEAALSKIPEVEDSSTLSYAVTEVHTQKNLWQNSDGARGSRQRVRKGDFLHRI